MSRIKRFLWLSANWRRRFTLVIHSSVADSYTGELQALCARLQEYTEYKSAARECFYGLLILIRAVNLFKNGLPRYHSFRLASDEELKSAAATAKLSGVADVQKKLGEDGQFRPILAPDNQPLLIHFFERYGYRFTVLLNLKAREGTVHHIERLDTYCSGESGVLALVLSNDI